MFAATPAVFKEWAVSVFGLGQHLYYGMDYAELGYPDGEVQVFANYRERVSAAKVARREVLATRPGLVTPDLEPVIWDRGTAVRERRR